jgi:hypothetical protein
MERIRVSDVAEPAVAALLVLAMAWAAVELAPIAFARWF